MYFGNLGPYILRNTHFGGHPTLSDNLVAYWKFEESSGPRRSSHGNTDFQIVGDAPTTVTGKSGSAVRIPSTSELAVSTNAAIWFSTVSSWTVSLWLFATAFGDTAIIARTYSAVGWEILSLPGGTTLTASLFGTTGSQVTATSTSFVHGQFNHVLAMFNGPGRTASISVNGEALITSTALGIALAQGTAMSIGPGYTSSLTTWDEMAIWQRLLTLDERNALYSGGVGRFY